MKGLTQAADIQPGQRVEDEADWVIIGSGAAGATAARVLTAAGHSVIMIEEGPYVPLDAFRHDMYGTFKTVWREMGFQVAQGRSFTPVLQAAVVGGTTAVNGAIMHRLPEPIHALWQHEHSLDSAFDYATLDAIWDTLDRELHVGTAPDAVFGRSNALMEQAVEKLGWKGNRIRRNVKDCRGDGHCNQGCPAGRRQSMNVSFVPTALEAGARLYATCAAEHFVIESGQAVGVVGTFRKTTRDPDHASLVARARRGVILAASAIQTPMLLLANGIGRRSGLVGQRLQAHPGTGVVGVFDESVKSWFGATQGYESTHFWDERMKFESVAMPLEFGAARLPGVGRGLMELLADYDKLAIWGVQIRAEAHGSVRRGLLGGTNIRYSLKQSDVAILKRGVHRLIEMMFAAGAREVLPGVHGLPERITSLDEARVLEALPDDQRRFHCIAAHLFGTAKLGPDPSRSVVDPRGECHDLPRLHVLDSSIFPTNMGVNPQHTICAMAWRASELLAGG